MLLGRLPVQFAACHQTSAADLVGWQASGLEWGRQPPWDPQRWWTGWPGQVGGHLLSWTRGWTSQSADLYPKNSSGFWILSKICQPSSCWKAMEVISHMSTQKYCTVAGKTVFSGSCATLLTELSRHLNLLSNTVQPKVIAGQVPDFETDVERQHCLVSALSGISMGWLPTKHAC